MNRLLRTPFKPSNLTRFYHPTEFKYDAHFHLKHSSSLQYLVNLYRKHGHHYANLDPLNLYNIKKQVEPIDLFNPVDLGIKYQHSVKDSLDSNHTYLAEVSPDIKTLEAHLRKIYTSNSGVEFDHLASLEEQTWLYHTLEKLSFQPLSNEAKRSIGELLIQTEAFDHFLHKKFVTFKRYSGEGAESAIVAMDTLFREAVKEDISDIVLGIPHRGRLNALVNLLEYPASSLFRKIAGKTQTPNQLEGAIDDVTSHIAGSTWKKYPTQHGEKTLHISTVHNPSHLEAQNPVSMGKTRSKQDQKTEKERKSVLNFQIHGDAAFSAQGIVYETFCISKTEGFGVDGTVHMVVNNQIGYTTRPKASRPSKYCTDVAKAFGVPIFHVNSDSIEDVIKAVKLALAYRQKFEKDFLIDLICYRRYGHNEVDEPEFTQPHMYKQIRQNQVSYPKQYFQNLVKEGIMAGDAYEKIRKEVQDGLEAKFVESKSMPAPSVKSFTDPKNPADKAFTHTWSTMKPSQFGKELSTGVNVEALKNYAEASMLVPPGFTVHPRIQKFHIEERAKGIQKNSYNWATCEAMAFFSLVDEGYNVRMSGQDVERGTFSQRHAVLTDQKDESQFSQLEFFAGQNPSRGNVEIINSALSENAVMSFEYGYSIDHPNNLAIWEAQFGDFFNPAQVVIDTYLTNTQAKWLRQSGLVLILPHGYDGAGPEHSSCRIERFLQLANSEGINRDYKLSEGSDNQKFAIGQDKFAENIKTANFSFVYPTRPANVFHVLRRQMKRDFRKPLVVAGPKTLLRLSKCVSTLEDMAEGTGFQRLIEYSPVIEETKKVFLCSGKFVYDIENMVQEKQKKDIAVVTIEELFPFPETLLKDILEKSARDCQVYWVQEENMNSGAYTFVEPRISRILEEIGRLKLKYLGRRALAATAVGSVELHNKESKELSDLIKSVIEE